jgi:uncharacterized protein (TIGR03085 family)
VTNYAQTERQALCDLMLEVGPDAPTLCEGWATADLAAHLVVRERRPDAGAGIVVRPLAGWTERVMESTRRSTDYADLVATVRSGPPLWSPVRLVPGVDALTNTVEFFVHHEDVRRARPGWEPRTLDPGLERELWSRVRRMGSLMLRRAPVSVTLENDAGERVTAGRGGGAVVVRGKPSELTLLAYGRAPQVRLDFEGSDADVAALTGARLGL